MSWTLRKKSDSFAGPGEISQEEGGELDSHEEVRLSFAGPGEIKRREVVLQVSPDEEIKNREVELG